MALPQAPAFFCHQALQRWRLLQPVGDARVQAQERAPGLLASWDHVHLDGVRDAVQAAAPLRPIFVDPGVREFDRATIQRLPAAAWIGRAAPTTAAEWDRSIGEALDAQR